MSLRMEPLTEPTRKQYLDGEVTHEEYYRALARTAGISYVTASEAFLKRVETALDEGDEHLNTIPLKEWDARTGGMFPSVSEGFRKHGDSDAPVGRVCMAKQAAKDAVRPPWPVETKGGEALPFFDAGRGRWYLLVIDDYPRAAVREQNAELAALCIREKLLTPIPAHGEVIRMTSECCAYFSLRRLVRSDEQEVFNR